MAGAVESRDQLRGEGFSEEVIRVELFLNLRYQGTDTKLSMPCHTARHDNDTDEAVVRAGIQAALQAFAKRYEREFGFTLPDRDVIADEIGGRAVATGTSLRQRSLSAATDPAVPSETAKIYFEGGWQDSAVYQLRDLTWGHVMDGPCMIIDNTSTILVEPNCRAEVVEAGDIRIVVGGVADAGGVDAALAETAPTTGYTPGQAIPGVPDASTLKACDPIQLAIFSHRFMGIAEQMGRTLQRTSISVNIKVGRGDHDRQQSPTHTGRFSHPLLWASLNCSDAAWLVSPLPPACRSVWTSAVPCLAPTAVLWPTHLTSPYTLELCRYVHVHQ